MTTGTPAMPRPMRADARRNYDTLVKVAGEVFAERGAQASLDEIACRAGVGPGTLYRHFPNRDALLAAVLRESGQEIARRAEECLAEPDPVRAISVWLLSLTRHCSRFTGLPDAIGASLCDERSPLGTTCHQLTDTTARLLGRGQDAGRIRGEVTTEDLTAVASALAWTADQQRRDPASLRRILDVFMAGLTPPD